jgi:putative redox protein
MQESEFRRVDLVRTSPHRFRATNDRGGAIDVGPVTDSNFTPVELLLAGIAACGGIDLDLVTRKRSEPEHFSARTTARKIRDEHGNRLVDLEVTFDVRFPDGEAGDAARAILERTVQQIQARLCTVSRTVAVGSPVEMRIDELG